MRKAQYWQYRDRKALREEEQLPSVGDKFCGGTVTEIQPQVSPLEFTIYYEVTDENDHT